MIKTYFMAVQRSYTDYIPIYVHTDKEQDVIALLNFLNDQSYENVDELYNDLLNYPNVQIVDVDEDNTTSHIRIQCTQCLDITY